MLPIKVRVPATTANIGCGFDVFGAALNLYNELSYELSEEDGVRGEISGEGEDFLRFEESNLVLKTMLYLAKKYDRTLPAGQIRLHNNIPLSRGLGSSSAAIVGALFLTNEVLDLKLSKKDLLQEAVSIEGHPDNVAPALMGNFTVSFAVDGKWQTIEHEVPGDWRWVVVWPNQPVSTAAARRVLPTEVALQAAIGNVTGAALLLSAIAQNRPELLKQAFQDHLHVPYRLSLIEQGAAVIEAAEGAGAYGATISGSGSTMLAIAAAEKAEAVAQAMQAAFGTKYQPQARILSICQRGVHLAE